MTWRSTMYNLMYRVGRPRWDTGVSPPELRAVVEGEDKLPPGRALDLGCGTGTNAIYLARHGWETVGVDFSPVAIHTARQKAGGVPGVTFLEGDVAQLERLGVSGLFDLVFDLGCYHGLPADSRVAYAHEVAALTRPPALFLLWAVEDRMTSIPGAPAMQPHEITDRFGHSFTLECIESADGRWKAGWHVLRRK